MPDVDIPNEVTSFSALGVSNNSYSATIFTPTATGLFRAAVTYIPSNGVPATVGIGWTDSGGFTNNVSVSGFTATAFFRSGASKAITVSVSGVTPPLTFDVYATVEQL